MSEDRVHDAFWGDRPVLVTGATGLIGSWLVRALLQRGATVTAFVLDHDPASELFRSGDIRRVSVVSGALEDRAAVERAVHVHEVETVFHLGAQTLVGVGHRDPVGTFESNVRGSWNLLEACRRAGGTVRRVVVASSDKAYGESEELPYREDMPLAARHPYEVSKAATDMIAQSYAHTYGMPVTIARCGNVYGGGDLNWSRLIPGTIRSLLRGERPALRSDGTFRRDYIYVEDVAAAYLRLAERATCDGVRGAAFNFSGEDPRSVLDVVGRIRALMEAEDLEPEVGGTPEGEIRDQYLSAARARSVLDWRPRFDLDTGLRRAIQWYRDYFDVD